VIRLSVSDLESLRYWRANEDADLASLIQRLMHLEPPTPVMKAGRAFAKLMENAPQGELTEMPIDGWVFRFELDAELSLPAVRELKAEVLFETPSGPVTLVGKVDGLHGISVHDQKLTERFDAERYLDSLQWRAYLSMFGAREFVYDVFVGRYDGRVVTINDYHRLPFYAYPEMRADVQKAVDDLAAVYMEHVIPAAERTTEAGAA